MEINQKQINEVASIITMQFFIYRKAKAEANQRKIIYEIFTPFHQKIWHKIIGKKPYLEVNYKSKLLQTWQQKKVK